MSAAPRGSGLLRVAAALLAAAGLAAWPCSAARAQPAPWPSKPIRLVVPSAPGGPTDLIARILAERLQRDLHQPGVIENRAGAGGKIGMRQVARAAPDGYTFVIGNPGPVAVVQHTETDVGYDTLRDFVPIAMLMRVPIRLVVRRELPVNSVQEFVAHLRAHPTAVAFGSSGEGQSPHMAAELLRNLIDVPFLIVPYRGAPPAVNDLLGGSVQAMFDTTTTVPFVREGRLKSLAIGSRTRSTLYPEVPTMAESGFPGFEISSWYVLLAPAGTPAEVIERMSALTQAALESKDVQEQLARVNAEAIWTSPSGARDYVAAEIVNWGHIVRTTGRDRGKAR